MLLLTLSLCRQIRYLSGSLQKNTQRKGIIMFRLEWNLGYCIVGTFAEVENHPAYSYATILRRVRFGWEVI